MDQLHQKLFCTIQILGQEAFRLKSPLGLSQVTNQNLAFVNTVDYLCPCGGAIHALSSDFNRKGSAQKLLPPRRATRSNNSSKSARQRKKEP